VEVFAPASASAVPTLCANEPTPSTMKVGLADGLEIFFAARGFTPHFSPTARLAQWQTDSSGGRWLRVYAGKISHSFAGPPLRNSCAAPANRAGLAQSQLVVHWQNSRFVAGTILALEH
jgi:hypothetical protein